MTRRVSVCKALIGFLILPLLHTEVDAITRAQERSDGSLINEIRNGSVLDGCGCYMKRQGKTSYVLLGEITDNRRAWMNIDGRDVRLTFVSSTHPARPLRRGDRFVQKYSIDGVIVEVTLMVTAPSPPEGEVTKYAATIKVTKNNRTQTVRATGECGC